MAIRYRTPGDDPNEYWAVCEDCDGTGTMNFPAVDEDGNVDEGVTEPGTCPVCSGLGYYSADADDLAPVSGEDLA
ncbi:hypothetical protein AB0P19_02395 [Microbacterium oleivorans]|uniref:hypothetical protein n=1 Tax=Microbacterium oleivorans TaxID=273677 RepID=UPI00342ADB35